MSGSLIPLALVALAAIPGGRATRPASYEASDVLARMRSVYAALTSYADSGTVLDERTGFTDRSTFRTYFTREPNNLKVDFRGVASEYTNGTRLELGAHVVLWMENGELQTWSAASAAHETYPRAAGQQVNAVKNAGYFTAGISVLVPSHLYSKSGLASAVHAAEGVEADGYEVVNGRKCHRLRGVERWRYPSGQETGVRAITIWIDAETYLLLKVFQDTPKGYPRNAIDRRTTTIKPRANPQLDPAVFRFEVPGE